MAIFFLNLLGICFREADDPLLVLTFEIAWDSLARVPKLGQNKLIALGTAFSQQTESETAFWASASEI